MQDVLYDPNRAPQPVPTPPAGIIGPDPSPRCYWHSVLSSGQSQQDHPATCWNIGGCTEAPLDPTFPSALPDEPFTRQCEMPELKNYGAWHPQDSNPSSVYPN